MTFEELTELALHPTLAQYRNAYTGKLADDFLNYGPWVIPWIQEANDVMNATLAGTRLLEEWKSALLNYQTKAAFYRTSVYFVSPLLGAFLSAGDSLKKQRLVALTERRVRAETLRHILGKAKSLCRRSPVAALVLANSAYETHVELANMHAGHAEATAWREDHRIAVEEPGNFARDSDHVTGIIIRIETLITRA